VPPSGASPSAQIVNKKLPAHCVQKKEIVREGLYATVPKEHDGEAILASRPVRKPMKFLALALALCGLILSGSARADQTCKAKANQQKLAGEALIKFVQQCEFEALEACQDRAAHKPDSESLMEACVVNALGVGSRWCVPHSCRTTSDCTGGAGCSVCWAGLCGE